MNDKPILCLDFDGVINNYSSGWTGALDLPDDVTEGFFEFCEEVAPHFRIVVHSSRFATEGAISSALAWMQKQRQKWRDKGGQGGEIVQIEFWDKKPPAMVTIDDRALTFTGRWGDFPVNDLLAFKPWNKQDPAKPDDVFAAIRAEKDAEARLRAAAVAFESALVAARTAERARCVEIMQAVTAMFKRAGTSNDWTKLFEIAANLIGADDNSVLPGTDGWMPIVTAPMDMEVETKIDDDKGVRAVQALIQRRRNAESNPMWWIPDGSMYVYYVPTHWRLIQEE